MGERMVNAPVFCALLQVQHNPILNVARYITSIQDALRLAGYPDYRPMKVVMFRFEASGDPSAGSVVPAAQPTDRHIFLNRNADRAVMLDSAALTLFVTAYETFESFSKMFFDVVDIVHKDLCIDYSQRIGLRYLNAIVSSHPEDGDLLRYLIPGVFGLAGHLLENAISQTFSETLLNEPDGNVVTRVLVRHGQLQLPADVMVDGLKLADRFGQINTLHAILDTDVSVSERAPFDVDLLRTKVSKLHDKARLMFDVTTTAEAKEEWR